jgi:aromatic ring hydroxylase
MLRTGEEYLRALDDGRRVWVGNERIDNVATHPKTRDYARRVADFYDLHHRPDLEEELTFVDESGERRSIMWFRPRDLEGLARRRRYYEAIARHLQAVPFHRLPDANNAVLLTYIDDPAPWEESSVGTEGRGLAANIVRWWEYFVEHDINTGPLFVDPQTDRGREEAQAEGPALRVVSSDDDGIIVNGVKAIGTATAFSDVIHVGVFFRPGIVAEQIIFAVLPTNTEGVTIVCRESLTDEDEVEHPLACRGDELDNTVTFDNVFIPWANVFHLGSPQHAMLYPQRVFDWLHHHIVVRAALRAELMAGLAILMSESIGTNVLPAVQTRVAQLVGFHQTLRSHMLASEYDGFHSPGGHWKPNILQVDFGRAYYLENLPRITHELLDLCGRAAMIFPTQAQWEDERLHKWLRALQTGPTKRPEERIRISRVVRDLFLTDWGDRQKMFDNFQGTPLMMIRFLTMRRAEFAGDGPATVLAREVCGIQLDRAAEDTDYTAQAKYARAQDAAAVAGAR